MAQMEDRLLYRLAKWRILLSRDFAIRHARGIRRINGHLVRRRGLRNLAVMVVCLSVHWGHGQAASAAGDPDSRQPVYRRTRYADYALPHEPVDGPKISSQSIAAAEMVMVVESGFRFRFSRPGDQRLLGP